MFLPCTECTECTMYTMYRIFTPLFSFPLFLTSTSSMFRFQRSSHLCFTPVSTRDFIFYYKVTYNSASIITQYGSEFNPKTVKLISFNSNGSLKQRFVFIFPKFVHFIPVLHPEDSKYCEIKMSFKG